MAHPRTGVAGFPGSGLLWLRHLIQQSTGFWTGSIKSSDKLVKIGWAGERLGKCQADMTLIAFGSGQFKKITFQFFPLQYDLPEGLKSWLNKTLL